MTQNKKYYTLYKVDSLQVDNKQVINDLKYLYEVNNYNDIAKYLNISKHKIKDIINNNINDFNNLKTYNNYCIILEE